MARDGYFIIAVGNDDQFRRLCTVLGAPTLADDPRFATNAARVRHRDDLVPLIETLTCGKDRGYWLSELERNNVPAGPVNALSQVFADPQVRHRKMETVMHHPLAGEDGLHMIASPLRLSETSVTYRRPPPLLGEHTDEVLAEVLGLDPEARSRLRQKGII